MTCLWNGARGFWRGFDNMLSSLFGLRFIADYKTQKFFPVQRNIFLCRGSKNVGFVGHLQSYEMPLKEQWI